MADVTLCHLDPELEDNALKYLRMVLFLPYFCRSVLLSIGGLAAIFFFHVE